MKTKNKMDVADADGVVVAEDAMEVKAVEVLAINILIAIIVVNVGMLRAISGQSEKDLKVKNQVNKTTKTPISQGLTIKQCVSPPLK